MSIASLVSLISSNPDEVLYHGYHLDPSKPLFEDAYHIPKNKKQALPVLFNIWQKQNYSATLGSYRPEKIPIPPKPVQTIRSSSRMKRKTGRGRTPVPRDSLSRSSMHWRGHFCRQIFDIFYKIT